MREGRMTRCVWQVFVTLVGVVLTSAWLSGCATRSPGSTPGDRTDGAARATLKAGGPGVGEPGTGGGGPGSAGADRAGPRPGTAIPPLPSPTSFDETAALRDVHFDFDQYRLRPDAAQILEESAQWLKTRERALLLIEGHADERGTGEYNLALGERRASTARDYLIALGVERARIAVVSYGKERPLCVDRTEACWAQNRRAHFLVKP
jgi:peptidoglycan-associated lipoprotein